MSLLLISSSLVPRSRRSSEESVSVTSKSVPSTSASERRRSWRHLVAEDGRAKKSGDESPTRLSAEGDPWSYVYAVGELDILSEVESVPNRNEPVRLVHDSGVPREPDTTEEFSNNVQHS